MSGRRATPFLILSLLAACGLASSALAPVPGTAPVADAQPARQAAFGIQVRQGRKPMPGIEVRLESEGPVRGASPENQVTDAEGRAEFWWLTPGIWRVDLVVDGEVAYFLTVRLDPGRRADEMGSPARDVDAPDLRWRFFRPEGPPPEPPPPPPLDEPTPRPTAPPEAGEPVAEAPPADEEEPAEPAPTATDPDVPSPQAPPEEPGTVPGEVPEDAADEMAEDTPAPTPSPAPPPAEPIPAEPEPTAEEPAVQEPTMQEPTVEEPAMETPVERRPPAAPAPEPATAEPEAPVETPDDAGDPDDAGAPPPPMMPSQDPPPTDDPVDEEPPVLVDEVDSREPPMPSGDEPEVQRPVERPVETPVETPVQRPAPPPMQPQQPTPPTDQPGVEEPQTIPEPLYEPPSEEPAEEPAEQPVEEPAPATPQPTPGPVPSPPAAQQPDPVTPPAPEPVAAAPVAAAPVAAPRFVSRSGAAGDCPDCKPSETAVTLERSVPPGAAATGATCGSGMAGAVLSAARSLASRGQGLGPGMPLDGSEVASYTSSDASCQVLGVVLPPGVRYRGYTYEVEAGGGAGGPCYLPRDCPVAGAVWPVRPVIEELEGGARMVYGVFRNASAVPLRAKLTIYYVAE